MSDSSNGSGIIGIHLLSPRIEAVNLGRSINLLLVSQLEELGYRTAFIPKYNYIFEPDSPPAALAHFARATRDGAGLEITKIPTVLPLGPATGAIQVVRARTASSAELEAAVPVVNGRKLRAFGADKWAQYTLLQDYMPQTVLVSEADDVTRTLLDKIATPQVVAKAVNGRDSKLLAIIEKSQAAQAVATISSTMAQKGQARSGIVLQAYQAGTAFTMLRNIAADDTALLSALRHDASSELRVYCFAFWSGLNLELETYAVYRVLIGLPSEAFIVVDQDSVPAEAFHIAEIAARRILEHTGAPGGLIAVDQILLPDGTLGIREINTRDPALAGLVSQDHDFQEAQVGRLVRLLIGLAQNR